MWNRLAMGSWMETSNIDPSGRVPARPALKTQRRPSLPCAKSRYASGTGYMAACSGRMRTDPSSRPRMLLALLLAAVLVLLVAIATGWYPAAQKDAAEEAEHRLALEAAGRYGLRD
jgi:hypothetical protein